MKVTSSELLFAAAVVIFSGIFVGDWIAGAAVLVWLVGFKLLVTGDGLSVLIMAFTFQWLQVSLGVFYAPVTGRTLLTILDSDYRPMVLIGLGCVLSVAAGVRLGIWLIRRRPHLRVERSRVVIGWTLLVMLYAVSVVMEGAIIRLGVEYASIRQLLVTVTVVRLGLLFLIMRRLVVPVLRWRPLAALLCLEVALGFTGFFAGFREPLVLAVMALTEVFDRHKASHWLSVTALVVIMAAASVMWMGVRNTYRADVIEIESLASSQSARFGRINDLGSAFFNSDAGEMKSAADKLVDRLWAVYYPALAVARVPSVVPHTDGSLLREAVQHILTPRIFFPDKPVLTSDSELVRRYAGIWVAGTDQNTSIAFGYAAESYIDFGVPMMFLPIALFGLVMGMAYAWLVRTILNHELAVASVSVIFWLALYLFERSWANTLGTALSLLVYLAIPLLLLDRFLSARLDAPSPALEALTGA